VRFFFWRSKQPFALGDFHFRSAAAAAGDERRGGAPSSVCLLRDRAFETAYATGMRLSEVTRLLITDIDSTEW
jgi:hypothetical protein